jgi:SAM-dependent methyltransferase
MAENQEQGSADAYWDKAGERGYGQAMYRDSSVEFHVRGRLWHAAIEIADALSASRDGRVLDVGCGDGAFANQMLAPYYREVDAFDKSDIAIRRAQAEASGQNATFRAVDLISFDLDSLPHYEAAFLIGILHHIKSATPAILRALAKRTDKMVVLEPNGNNLMRKAMELTSAYRRAGEDSFRTKDLIAIFAAAGWQTISWQRLNLFPNFTPGVIYRWLAPLEPWVEQSQFWNMLCTVDLYGLKKR